ncbi:uncharacterized protein LOC129796986 isoform X2 [Lutzomyia longipalpis]|uniref:uncharacterized protein LOC129796986 isoform X2 n=1 Tax=Lutzomyia longipalpis TaxID=7200 RepID=UPI002483A808|nr:uncharacterized protein LOC129796986 isoform X2 [Lutzomyia longipalpis]
MIGLQGQIFGNDQNSIFKAALHKFFDTFTHGVITCNLLSIAIFKINNLYYYFDSHSRGNFAQFVENGKSILCAYTDIISLYNILKYNFLHGNLSFNGQIPFAITPIHVQFNDNTEDNISTSELLNIQVQSEVKDISLNDNNKSVSDTTHQAIADRKREYSKLYKQFRRFQSRSYKNDDNERRRKLHRKERLILSLKQIENLKRKHLHIIARQDPALRSLENIKRKEQRKIERQDPAIKSLENIKRKVRHKIERQDPVIKSLENVKRKEQRKIERQDPAIKSLENVKRKERHKIERTNINKKFSENKDRKMRNILKRKDPKFRRKENLLRMIRKQKCKINTHQVKVKPKNFIDTKIEKSLKAKYSSIDQEKFENQILMFRDKLKRSLKIKVNYNYKKLGNKNFKLKVKKMKDKNRTLLEFFDKRKQVTHYICGCCEGKFFRHNVKELNINKCKYKNKSDLEDFLKISKYCCTTCHTYLNRNKLPTLAIKNGLAFPEIPDCLKDLSELEERMVAPIINFMEIRELKKYALNPQKGLKGSVVHIPVEINDMVKVLPRRFDNMNTVQVKLKRHEDYKSHYMFETVRIRKVLEAINYLVTTPLYISEGITVDPNYLKDIGDIEISFIVDPEDQVKDEPKGDDKVVSPEKKEIPPEIFTLSGKDNSQPSSFKPDAKWNIQDVRNSEIYVNSDHTERFIEIINKLYKNNHMFPTFYICDMGLKHVKAKGRNKRNVQILFLEPKGDNKIGHWVTTVHKDKTIYVYDSLDWKTLNEDCIKFLKKMYPTTMKKKDAIKFMKTFQQIDSYSCGVHAIANSVALLNNINVPN